jgi:type II secretory pathway pseudopilin PulG
MARTHSSSGFGIIENMVVASLMAMGVLISVPFAGTMIRRAEGVGAVNAIQSTLAAARLQAVKTGVNVVVVISKSANDGIRLQTFRDKEDLTSPSANDGNGTRENGEPILGTVDLDTHVHLWIHGGAKDDLEASAVFDGYTIDGVVNPDLTHRIIFLPTGGIAAPQNSNSGSPQPTAPYGRGIYFADLTGKNFFRITISSAIASGTRVDKYSAGKGYVSGTWSWQ